MKKMSMLYVISLVILLGITNLMAFGPDNVHKEFTGKSIVKIKTVSGDCIVKTDVAIIPIKLNILLKFLVISFFNLIYSSSNCLFLLLLFFS